MPQRIIPIRMLLPFRLGSVSCYLIETPAGFVLIDTGSSNRCVQLEQALVDAGCKPGNLNLIVITHGDFDHTGNAAYLRDRFGAKIAMHADDSGMAERGDMFWNRKKGSALLRRIAPFLFGFGPSKRFTANVSLEDGFSLADFGIDAAIISLPGHSKGSIGILTADGELFCGDLFDNTDKPALNSIMDDPAAARISFEKLKGYTVDTVYPGHGTPFSMQALFHAAANDPADH